MVLFGLQVPNMSTTSISWDEDMIDTASLTEVNVIRSLDWNLEKEKPALETLKRLLDEIIWIYRASFSLINRKVSLDMLDATTKHHDKDQGCMREPLDVNPKFQNPKFGFKWVKDDQLRLKYIYIVNEIQVFRVVAGLCHWRAKTWAMGLLWEWIDGFTWAVVGPYWASGVLFFVIPWIAVPGLFFLGQTVPWLQKPCLSEAFVNSSMSLCFYSWSGCCCFLNENLSKFMHLTIL